MNLLVANPRRRQLLVALTVLAGSGTRFSAPCVAAAVTRFPHRIVVLNWELTETLLALGRAPVGIPLPDWYASGIVTPPLPAGVADVGLLYQPNFEVLLALAPDLIIVTPAHAALMTPLRRIAPTLTLGTYMSAARPLEVLCDETAAMGRAIGAPLCATELIAAAQQEFASVATRIASTGAHPARAVIVTEALDERHFRVYGAGSLFDDVLARIGVDNAAHSRDAASRAASTPWRTSVTGSATVALERLFDVPHADILLIGPLRAAVRAALNQSPLWRALPAVREKRVAVLPVIAAFGGLVSMQRFAAAVSVALATLEHGGGDLA